ncbi:hypothetical protein [Sphingobacterium kitahiroshimense]|uniref:hypothetical protein n=1 Tax=Sphingobacterium kitahiroshimense TaxID=470446 RepID=UPI003208BDBC
MKINIGDIIKREASKQGISNSLLATKLNAKNPQNIDYDLKQEILSLDKLRLYSEVLNHNFLQYYYNEEPYKTFRERENEAFLSEIKKLKEQLEDANKTISLQESHIKTQQELIETQRALIVKLKG